MPGTPASKLYRASIDGVLYGRRVAADELEALEFFAKLYDAVYVASADAHIMANGETLTVVVDAGEYDVDELGGPGSIDRVAVADELERCEGHESTAGPIGSTVYCDGSCKGQS